MPGKYAGLCLAALLVFGAGVFAPLSAEVPEEVQDFWHDFSEAGKATVEGAGELFSAAGKRIREAAAEAAENTGFSAENRETPDNPEGRPVSPVPAVCGVWKYDGGSAQTRLTVREDGTMEAEWSESFGSSTVWRGTWSDNGSMLRFSITEQAQVSFLKERIQDVSLVWKILYRPAEDGRGMWFTSSDMPVDSAGNGFSDGRLFTGR